MRLETDRLILRPLAAGDIDWTAGAIFADPEVCAGLAHDISDPAARRPFAEGWCLGQGETGPAWRAGGVGAFAVEDRSGAIARPGDPLGVVGVFDAARRDGIWTGEYFHAFAGAFQGRGLAAEAGVAALAAWAALPGAGPLYACWWGRLNPRSGAVLARFGFGAASPLDLLDEYDAPRAASFARFELWRLATAAPCQRARVGREAAVKLGHLAREAAIALETALADLRRLWPDGGEALDAAFAEGLAHAGMLRSVFTP